MRNTKLLKRSIIAITLICCLFPSNILAHAEKKQDKIIDGGIWGGGDPEGGKGDTQNISHADGSGKNSNGGYLGDKPLDKTKPKLMGVKYLKVKVGTKVSFRKGIKSTDNLDGNITKKIKINSKHVNLKKAGKYPLWYAVTDKAGNKTVKKVYVTVVAKKAKAEKQKIPFIDSGEKPATKETENVGHAVESGESTNGGVLR